MIYPLTIQIVDKCHNALYTYPPNCLVSGTLPLNEKLVLRIVATLAAKNSKNMQPQDILFNPFAALARKYTLHRKKVTFSSSIFAGDPMLDPGAPGEMERLNVTFFQ